MDKRYYNLEVSFITITTAIAFLINNYMVGNNFNVGLFSLSILISIIFFSWLSFNNYIWRILSKIKIIDLPDLNGKWVGTLDFFTSDEGKKSTRIVDVEILIEQKFRSIKVTYKGTDKDIENKKITESYSVAATITNNNGEFFQLRYIFNKKNVSYDKGGSGFAELDIDLNSTPISMSGWWLADPMSPSGGKVIHLTQTEKKALLPESVI